MVKILLVEDEVNIAQTIKRGLEENGYEVDMVHNGQEGFILAMNNEYGLMILDIILPGMNGIELCRLIREKKGYEIPIIILSALGSTDDVVKGLDTGADDYLLKPFRFRELLARINSALRRQQGAPLAKVYRIADLELDPEKALVTRAGDTILLTATEYHLLLHFMKNIGKVLSRRNLLENVWKLNFDVGTNLVGVYISYLRDKVDKNYSPKLIHTLKGIGYVLREE